MRGDLYLPWAPGGAETEDDARVTAAIWEVAHGASCHMRMPARDVAEQIYRVIGHDYALRGGGAHE